MTSPKCSKCGKNEWVINEKVCLGQDCVSVECECNTTSCGEIKQIFVDISEGIEDFN